MKKNYSGFTIVELVVVVVIIGVLASIVLVSYNSITKSTAIAGMKADLKYASVRLGIDNSRDGSYPATLELANGGKGITAKSGMTYRYIVTPKNNYCLSIAPTGSEAESTPGSESYYVSSPSGTVKQGTCMYSSLTTNMISYYSLNDSSGLTVTDSYGLNNGAIKTYANIYYPFDGNSIDGSTTANNGVVSGATLTTDRFGNSNSAYSFNGTSNYIVSTNTISVNTATTNYIFSAWVYALNNTANSWEAVVMDDNGSGVNSATFGISMASNGTKVGAWACGNQGSAVTVPSILNGWHHIVAVYTKNSTTFTPVKMYVDGVYVGNSVTDRSTACSFTKKFGLANTYSGYSTWFKGSIDEVVINATTGSAPTNGDIAKLYTLTSTHDINKPWVAGNVNGGLDFWGHRADSNNSLCSYIDMGTGFNSIVKGIATPFTLSYWTYKSSVIGYTAPKQFGWYGGNYKGAFIGVKDDGGVEWTVGKGATTGSNSNYGSSLTAGTVPANQWNHLALVYDGTNVVVYLNGVVKSTYNIGTYVDNGSGTQRLIVNKQPWDLYGATTAKYDEMAAWSRGLTAGEIKALYNAGVGVVYP